MKVAVVGAGPAGLYFARLLKKARPDYDIRVFEQNPERATYGFGVTLAGNARDRLRNLDAEVFEELEARMVMNDAQAICLNGERIIVKYASKGGAIARLDLLAVLERSCRDIGVDIMHDRRIHTEDDVAEFDLVVGADGANSVVRGFDEAHYGAVTETLRNRFAWYGVNKALKPNALSFRNVEGGVFVAHYYSYTPEMSTFVAECDGETWDNFGIAEMTDQERESLIERIFEAELEGQKLVKNKSDWRQFKASVATRWNCRNRVLIGDSLRVAHPTIGSGTRLAMDDAVALFKALLAHEGDLPAAFAQYETQRRPNRDLFTSATVRSYSWYERVRETMKLGQPDFVLDFLTRTGRIDGERLKSYVPDFYRDYIQTGKLAEPGVVG